MRLISSIQDKYGLEQAIVILVCRVYLQTASSASLDELLTDENINWDRLYSVILKNRIRPIAHQVLSKTTIPADFKKQLQDQNLSISVGSMQHLKELLHIAEALDKKGIEAIPYKGLVFSAQYYHNYNLREFSDLDFLILLKSAEDLNTIRIFFEENGYQPMYDIPDNYTDAFIKYGCEYYFNKYSNGVRKFHIDLHWLAYHPSFDLPKSLPNDILFQNSSTITISNKTIRTLHPDSHFIALVLHHGLREGWSNLKYLMDYAQIIKSGRIDWAYQNKISTEYQYSNVQQTGMLLMNDLLGVDIPVAINDSINTTYYTDVLLSGKPKQRSLFNKQSRKIRLVDKFNGRIAVLLKTIQYSFAPSRLDYDYFKLPKNLFFLYFFVKIARLIAPAKEAK